MNSTLGVEGDGFASQLVKLLCAELVSHHHNKRGERSILCSFPHSGNLSNSGSSCAYRMFVLLPDWHMSTQLKLKKRQHKTASPEHESKIPGLSGTLSCMHSMAVQPQNPDQRVI